MKKRSIKALSVLLTACILFSAAFGVTALAVKRGDIDGNGSVTAEDARLALRAAVELQPIEKGTFLHRVADVDDNGEITAEDARQILRIAVELDPELPEIEPQAAPVTGKTGYDILRSGTFYMEGSTVENGEETPMVMGIGKDLIYMEMDADGMHMGLLVKGDDMIFVNPEAENYWKPNKMELSMLTSFGFPNAAAIRKEAESYGFTSLKPLKEADKKDKNAVFEGMPCTLYSFDLSDGSVYRVYMDGKKLLALESLNAEGGQDMLMKIGSITSKLPQLPPKEYKSAGVMDFMGPYMAAA